MATPEDIKIRISAQNDSRTAFKQVDQDLKTTARTAKTTVTEVNKTSGALGGMGRSAGQAGIQIQQFVGQVQGGVSPLVAFSQQATDLGFVLGFPLLGAVLGIGSALVGTMIPALMGTGDKAEELSNDLKEANNDLVAFLESIKDINAIDYSNKLTASFERQQAASAKLNELLEQRATLQMLNERQGVNGNYTMLKDLDAQISAAEALILEEQTLRKQLDASFGSARSRSGGKNSGDYQLDLQDNMTNEFLRQQEARTKAAEKAAREQADLERIVSLDLERELNERIKKEQEAMKYQLDMQAQMSKAYVEQQEANQRELDILTKDALQQLKPIEDAFVNLINGSKEVGESFKDMARSIVNDLIRIQIQQTITKPLAGMIGEAGGIGGILGGILGGPAKALGGSVSAGQAYTVGEHGRETFIPSTSGTIVPNGEVGGGVTIVQNINVSTGVQQTVRTEIAQLMPQIANAAKGAVLDARKRGGSYAAAFGG